MIHAITEAIRLICITIASIAIADGGHYVDITTGHSLLVTALIYGIDILNCRVYSDVLYSRMYVFRRRMYADTNRVRFSAPGALFLLYLTSSQQLECASISRCCR